jgi:hypothetical protein
MAIATNNANKYASEYPLPGGVEQYFETLLALLRYIRDAAEATKAGVDRASDYLEGMTDQDARIAGYATSGILNKFRDEFEYWIEHKQSRFDGTLECPRSS